MPEFTKIDHRPWVGRRFGVEMEMNTSTANGTGSLSMDQIARKLRTVCSLPVNNRDGWGASSGATWDVKTDATCGYEVASPALTFDANGHCEELRRACNAIEAMRPDVDRTCGLHVHVDLSDFNWKEVQMLLSLWVRYEPFFYSVLPENRHTNSYCKPMRAAKWRNVAQPVNSWWNWATNLLAARTENEWNAARSYYEGGRQQHTKYSALNLNHWWYSNRVEFRLHSGSVNYTKIRNWTLLLLSLVQRVKMGTRAPALSNKLPRVNEDGYSAEYVLTMLGVNDSRFTVMNEVGRELIAWVKRRQQKFGHVAVRVRREQRRDATAQEAVAEGGEPQGTRPRRNTINMGSTPVARVDATGNIVMTPTR